MLATQSHFQQKLSSYLDGSCFSNLERVIFPILGRRACRKRADSVIQAFDQFTNELTTITDELIPTVVKVEPYSENHPFVHQLHGVVNGKLKESLVGAYVHGSLGTGEEINYSDFDALLILRDSVFETAQQLTQVSLDILNAQKILTDYDPLQHHGFFVMSQTDLRYYPDSVFPTPLFGHAKSLIQAGEELKLLIPNVRESAMRPLVSMLDAIERKAKQPHLMTNLFEVKLFLSQLMLVPCLFLQAMDCPIFKRESFAMALKHLDKGAWRAVDVASTLRRDWPRVENWVASRVVRSIPNPFLTTIYQKKIGIAVPKIIEEKLTAEFFESSLELVRAIRKHFKIKTFSSQS